MIFCLFDIYIKGEIGRRSGGDNVLEREGYAVSAGFSLGLVALGMISFIIIIVNVTTEGVNRNY